MQTRLTEGRSGLNQVLGTCSNGPRVLASCRPCRPGKCGAILPRPRLARTFGDALISIVHGPEAGPILPIGRGRGNVCDGCKADPSVHQRRHLKNCLFGTRPLLLVVRHQPAGYLLCAGPMPAAGNDQSSQSCGPSSVSRFQVEDSASAAESPMSWEVSQWSTRVEGRGGRSR